ncbi:MAG: hypothetical protein ABL958_20725 [Bdellovibrionia bacterium]
MTSAIVAAALTILVHDSAVTPAPEIRRDYEIAIGQTERLSKLPDWLKVAFINTDTFEDRALAEAELCGARGWKILVGRGAIHSNGVSGESPRLKKLLQPLIEKCGVDFYISDGDRHQEHITAQGFEEIVQGAKGRARGVDQKMYKPGDTTKQRFARAQPGYAVLELLPTKIALRFFDEKSNEIYFWSAGPREIGLARFVPTRLSAER